MALQLWRLMDMGLPTAGSWSPGSPTGPNPSTQVAPTSQGLCILALSPLCHPGCLGSRQPTSLCPPPHEPYSTLMNITRSRHPHFSCKQAPQVWRRLREPRASTGSVPLLHSLLHRSRVPSLCSGSRTSSEGAVLVKAPLEESVTRVKSCRSCPFLH